jgi:uncharacterized membrane protein YjgN (DUF898 family)
VTQPPAAYGPPPPHYGPVPPDHPQATTVLILGIVSVVACGVAGPFAWVMGNRVVREIDASHGAWGGRSNAQVGRILGIVETCILGVVVLGLLALVFVGVLGAATSSSG